MALPSVVSPKASSLSPSVVIDSSSAMSASSDPSSSFYGGMLFGNPDFSSNSSAHFNTPATIFLENQDSNHTHSGSVNSHSLHSEDHSDCLAVPTSYGAKAEDCSPHFFDFGISSEQHQLFSQLDQPGTSQQQLPQPILLPSSPATSPQSSLELSSLQQSLEKNRESLKHKLSHRASIRDLVCRGIYPNPRIPIAHAEQRRKLERAKTGDLLRHHIQSRPDRDFLVGQNILQADGRIDVRIAARQKELKKCRLAENLNQHLVTRPGPLDLVDRNILKAPQQLHIALRSGLLPISSTKLETEVAHGDSQFGATSAVDTATVAPAMPSSAAFVFDPVAPGATVVHSSSTAANTAIPMILSNQHLAVYTPLSTIAGSVTPCDYVILQQQQPDQQLPQNTADLTNSFSPSGVPSAKKGTTNFKVAKTQTSTTQRTKAQTLKFHEYKGPPEVLKAKQQQSSDVQSNVTFSSNARRLPSTSVSAARDHLEALITQQSLYLKYQKDSNGSPTNSGSATSSGSVNLSSTNIYQHVSLTPSSTATVVKTQLPLSSTPPSNVISPIPVSSAAVESSTSYVGQHLIDPMVTRQVISELRVSELRSYCRQLRLPISGTKQTLIDRLDARLNVNSHHHHANSNAAPQMPAHSSSALFFGDPNSMMLTTTGGSNAGTAEEMDEEVITISSSASSPGIVHDNDAANSATMFQFASAGWNPSASHNSGPTDQLIHLHNCVESQQRRIEQLTVELQFERDKRMNENTSTSLRKNTDPSLVSSSTLNDMNSWQSTGCVTTVNQNDYSQKRVPETGVFVNEPPNDGSVGVAELDDIMDLIGSFPDVTVDNGCSPQVNMAYSIISSQDVKQSSSPQTVGDVWHMNELGMSQDNNNQSASPMSPWMFDADNDLHYSAAGNRPGGMMPASYHHHHHNQNGMAPTAVAVPCNGYYEIHNSAVVNHNANMDSFSTMDEFYTQH